MQGKGVSATRGCSVLDKMGQERPLSGSDMETGSE